MRETHREVLVALASQVRRRSPEEALVILDRVLGSDPLHEGAVRAVMTVLAQLGRRSEALARYERLRDGLLDEFGTDPDAQTARPVPRAAHRLAGVGPYPRVERADRRPGRSEPRCPGR